MYFILFGVLNYLQLLTYTIRNKKAKRYTAPIIIQIFTYIASEHLIENLKYNSWILESETNKDHMELIYEKKLYLI